MLYVNKNHIQIKIIYLWDMMFWLYIATEEHIQTDIKIVCSL